MSKINDKTKVCTHCKEEKTLDKFVPYYSKPVLRNICRKCSSKRNYQSIKNNPVRSEKIKNYLKEYYKNNNYILKFKAYKHFDKQKNLETLTLKEFRELLFSNPICFYCNENNILKIGLDRKDNILGHSLNNVVLCCEKCNFILGDLPFEAKILLKNGLQEIKANNLLVSWEIKTKRRFVKN